MKANIQECLHHKSSTYRMILGILSFQGRTGIYECHPSILKDNTGAT